MDVVQLGRCMCFKKVVCLNHWGSKYFIFVWFYFCVVLFSNSNWNCVLHKFHCSNCTDCLSGSYTFVYTLEIMVIFVAIDTAATLHELARGQIAMHSKESSYQNICILKDQKYQKNCITDKWTSGLQVLSYVDASVNCHL